MRKPGTTPPRRSKVSAMMNNPWRKEIITPTQTFPSVKEASRQLGISIELINYRCAAGARQRAALAEGKDRPGYIDFTGWEKRATADRERGYRRPVNTPAGRFESITAAADHYQVTAASILNRIRRWSDEYSYAD